MGVQNNEIKVLRNEDRASIQAMQQMLVNMINENYPKPFTHQIDFNNWNQMMHHIRKNHRRNDA